VNTLNQRSRGGGYGRAKEGGILDKQVPPGANRSVVIEKRKDKINKKNKIWPGKRICGSDNTSKKRTGVTERTPNDYKEPEGGEAAIFREKGERV